MESPEFRVIFAACLVAWVLSGLIGLDTRASDRQEADVLVRLFGGTAEIASQSAMKQADLYLHAGAGYASRSVTGVEQPRPLPLKDAMTRLHDATAPTEHKHIQGAEEKELLPWFVIAARLNRHNVEAWLDGTYWFYRTGQSAQAERFVAEAIRNNPTDHRVYLERGILYHRLKQYEKAENDLTTSIRLYRKLSEESPFELKAARIYLRDSQERLKASAGDRS